MLVIDIAPGKFRPYYLANKTKETTSYIRINGTSRPADARKLQELELKGQGISYDSLQDIGREFEQKKALDLCAYMKQTAINACKTEEEKASIKDMTLEKLEDFGLLCKVGRDRYPTHAFDLMTDNHNKAAKFNVHFLRGFQEIYLSTKRNLQVQFKNRSRRRINLF